MNILHVIKHIAYSTLSLPLLHSKIHLIIKWKDKRKITYDINMHESAVHECKIMRKWNNCEIHSVCGVITDQLKFAMNCKIHPTQPLPALNHKRCSTIKCIPNSMHKCVRCSFEFGYIFFPPGYRIISQSSSTNPVHNKSQCIHKSCRVCYQFYDILLLLLILLSLYSCVLDVGSFLYALRPHMSSE